MFALLALSGLPSGANEGEKGGESEPTLEHGDPPGSAVVAAESPAADCGFGTSVSVDVDEAALFWPVGNGGVSADCCDSVGESGTDSAKEAVCFGDCARSRKAAFADDCAAAAAKKAVGAI